MKCVKIKWEMIVWMETNLIWHIDASETVFLQNCEEIGCSVFGIPYFYVIYYIKFALL